MEEPLGCRLFSVRIAIALFGFFALASSPSAARDERPCSDRLLDKVATAIDHVSENRPENTDQARRILHELQPEIIKRVHHACPEPASCSDQQLADALLEITHEVLDENPPRKSSWRSNLIFGGSLVLYTTLSVWVTLHTESMAAAAASSLLTLLGAMAITHSGASKIEVPLAKLRRASYSADGGRPAQERGKRQRRHEQIYWGTQAAVDSIEEEGRDHESVVVNQICAATNSCAPRPWDTQESYQKRMESLLAKLLSNLVPSYLEFDFSDPFYSTWFRTIYSEWELSDTNRENFRSNVLTLIRTFYDGEAKQGSEREAKYQRVLRAWTAPLQPLISPRGNHQSRIAPPSRRAIAPSLGWPLAAPSLRFG